MKHFILFSLMMFIGIHLFSQEIKMNQKIFDQKSNHDIMIGYCSLAGMTGTPFDSSYQEEYSNYKPDREIISQINPLMEGVNMTIVMGTWCSDSREQVPRFMKVIHSPDHSMPDPVLICVDRDKKAGDVPLEGMDIMKIPTFIIYYKGHELGRIIETPSATLEKDLLEIMKKQQK
jgi:hypothetical protein